jgi:hypothetical protein
MSQLDYDIDSSEDHEPNLCDDPYCPLCNSEIDYEIDIEEEKE